MRNTPVTNVDAVPNAGNIRFARRRGLVKKGDARWNTRLLSGVRALDEGLERVAAKVLLEPYGPSATKDVMRACETLEVEKVATEVEEEVGRVVGEEARKGVREGVGGGDVSEALKR